MPGRQLASKWRKTQALLSDPRIAAHIPKTRLYSAIELKNMLHQFGMVVIKPVCGGGGYGVIRVEYSGGVYRYITTSRSQTFNSFDSLYRSLNSVRVRRQYLIQQGIHLAQISGRPIDYRVKMVKQNGKWVCRAMVGRLARSGLFVTNLCKGGMMLSGRQGLSLSLSKRLVSTKRREMRELTGIGIRVLESAFPGIGQLGFDYGIDKLGRIWIFEVNTRPQ